MAKIMEMRERIADGKPTNPNQAADLLKVDGKEWTAEDFAYDV